jgi:8-oxo-dGTP pyrophosphatase MutT (NUDIX family)
VREVKEETGFDVEITRLVGIYSDPGYIVAYSDGEVRQQFSICFSARQTGGSAHEDGTETKQVTWVPVDQLDQLRIHPSMRLRIDHYLEDRSAPFIG